MTSPNHVVVCVIIKEPDVDEPRVERKSSGGNMSSSLPRAYAPSQKRSWLLVGKLEALSHFYKNTLCSCSRTECRSSHSSGRKMGNLSRSPKPDRQPLEKPPNCSRLTGSTVGARETSGSRNNEVAEKGIIEKILPLAAFRRHFFLFRFFFCIF